MANKHKNAMALFEWFVLWERFRWSHTSAYVLENSNSEYLKKYQKPSHQNRFKKTIIIHTKRANYTAQYHLRLKKKKKKKSTSKFCLDRISSSKFCLPQSLSPSFFFHFKLFFYFVSLTSLIRHRFRNWKKRCSAPVLTSNSLNLQWHYLTLLGRRAQQMNQFFKLQCVFWVVTSPLTSCDWAVDSVECCSGPSSGLRSAALPDILFWLGATSSAIFWTDAASKLWLELPRDLEPEKRPEVAAHFIQSLRLLTLSSCSNLNSRVTPSQ